MALRVADHLRILNTILGDYGLGPDALELVPDVLAWCRKHEIEEDNAFPQAMCFRCISDDSFHIVMTDVLTDDMIALGKCDMECLGLPEVSTLDTDVKYLVHLLLHQVAARVLQTSEQMPRDMWAFDRVANYAS